MKRVDPYAVAIALFTEMHRRHAFMRSGHHFVAFKALVDSYVTTKEANAESQLDYAALRNLLGMASMMSGKDDEAEQEFLRAANADPNIGYAWINLGLLYIAEKRFDEALAMIKNARDARAVKTAPFLLANALTVRGLALWGKHDLQGAADSFLLAARVYPQTFFGYYYWAKLMESVGDVDAATLLTERANVNIFNFEVYPESVLLYFGVRTDKDFSLSHLNLNAVRNVAEVAAQQ